MSRIQFILASSRKYIRYGHLPFIHWRVRRRTCARQWSTKLNSQKNLALAVAANFSYLFDGNVLHICLEATEKNFHIPRKNVKVALRGVKLKSFEPNAAVYNRDVIYYQGGGIIPEDCLTRSACQPIPEPEQGAVAVADYTPSRDHSRRAVSPFLFANWICFSFIPYYTVKNLAFV